MTGITFNIWAVIILFGAAQGLFLSIYLFTKSENRDANKWLAFLLTAISLHLFEYGADISGITMKYPFLLASTYPLLFCFGPLYFIYCRYLLDKNYKVSLKSMLHFIPAVLVLLMFLPFYTMPENQKISFILNLESNGNLKIPTEQLVFMAIHVVQTVIYVYASYEFIHKKEQALKEFSSDVLVVKKINWLNTFSLYFGIWLLLYFLLVLVLTFINSFQIQVDYVMLLITSLSLYAIGYSAIQSPEIFKSFPEVEFHISELNSQTPPTVPPIAIGAIGMENGNRFPELKQKLMHFMETNKPYLKSDLKISELADSLFVPYHQLSQLINDEFLVNFYDFINKHRVEDAKKLLIEDNRNYKILAIAYEVGFNSKATFNRVFKKFTDLTPSEFKEKFSPSSAKGEVSEA
jgi:AraC-like DNA-binding protein